MGLYACSVCFRTYRKRFLLLYHLRQHTGRYAYVCHNCGIGYEQLSDLLKHQTKAHSSYSMCSRCGQSFKENFYYHHKCIEIVPYVCESCGAGFTKLPDLVTHNEKCDNDICYSPNLREYHYHFKGSYNCYTCELKFAQLSELIQHRMKDHIKTSNGSKTPSLTKKSICVSKKTLSECFSIKSLSNDAKTVIHCSSGANYTMVSKPSDSNSTIIIKGSPSNTIKESPSSTIKDSPFSTIKDTTSSIIKGSPSSTIKDTPSSTIRNSSSSIIKDTLSSTSTALKDSPSSTHDNTDPPFSTRDSSSNIRATTAKDPPSFSDGSSRGSSVDSLATTHQILLRKQPVLSLTKVRKSSLKKNGKITLKSLSIKMSSSFTCFHCKVILNDAKSLNRHIRLKHLRKRFCVYCERVFYGDKGLKTHIRASHKKSELHYAVNCCV